MREIKFRAWNARTGFTVFELGAVLPEPLHNYYVSQYTGLKDKNGVEIYEGDIVKHSRIVKQSGKDVELVKTWEVKWLDELAAFDTHGIALAEVIGNIYENKELLK